MWIEIPVVCHADGSEELSKLGLDIDKNVETKDGLFNVNLIMAVVPAVNENQTVIEAEGTSFLIDLPYKALKDLIY